jgi:hypothetical protein
MAPLGSTRCAPVAKEISKARNVVTTEFEDDANETLEDNFRLAVWKYLDCLGETCEDADAIELEHVMLLGVKSCAELLEQQAGDCHYDLSATVKGKRFPEDTQVGYLCSATCASMCNRLNESASIAPKDSGWTAGGGRFFRASRPAALVNGTNLTEDENAEFNGITGGPEADGRPGVPDGEQYEEWLKKEATKWGFNKPKPTLPPCSKESAEIATTLPPCEAAEEEEEAEESMSTSREPRPA